MGIDPLESYRCLMTYKPDLKEAARDYELVRRNIDWLRAHWREQPSLERLAGQNGFSPAHLQRLFMRWAGLSPKAFVQALTIDHARKMLLDSASILETAHEVGLSGPGRLHDLFVTHEAMTPGSYKARGRGLTIRYGFHDCQFGRALLMLTKRGICGLAFADLGKEQAVLVDMRRRWPAADYVEDLSSTGLGVARIFDPQRWKAEQPLRIVFIGTDFETQVWEMLLKLPLGHATSYSEIAARLGKTGASRAVGSAVGRNPISFVVPCHRVLTKSGSLGGYHWGVTRKQAILGWEAGLISGGAD